MNKNWQTIDNKLYKKFAFERFTSAIAFIVELAFYAEEMQHHPELRNVYNTVEVWLTTHDAGNTITEKDNQLANMADKIYTTKQK